MIIVEPLTTLKSLAQECRLGRTHHPQPVETRLRQYRRNPKGHREVALIPNDKSRTHSYSQKLAQECRFFPDKAASLAQEIVNELIQELKIRPCPIIFASFSGGPKACMYKVLQIIEGKHEEQISQDECRLVRDSISGYIFDSCPVDFVSDLGKRFILHQTGFKISRPPLVASWITSGISSTMEALFLSRLESQRAEYWQTLYSTVSFRAPYLILCSEDDELAPFQIIFNFASRLKNLGADVKLVKWNKSSHVGHFRHHPEEYSAAVTELLRKAAITYSQRIRQLEGEKMGVEGGNDEISDPFNGPRKAAAVSREAVDLNDYLDVPSSVEYQEDRDEYIALWSSPKMSAHGPRCCR